MRYEGKNERFHYKPNGSFTRKEYNGKDEMF